MQRNSRLVIMLVILTLMFALALGCQKKPVQPNGQANQTSNEEIKKLLPNQAGYHWVYNGFAEYGHSMDLKTITTGDTETVYTVTGEVFDASGGAAQGDFSLSIDYLVRDGRLMMRQKAPRLMDSFTELELLRVPLQAQATWEQKALNKKDNKEYQLACTILEVKNEADGKVYVVEYKDKNSNFYEKRWLKENIGIINFETVWNSPEGPVEMGYFLYNEASGYPRKLEFTSYLPPLQQKLRYFGLAEYAHVGQLAKTSENEQQGIYQFNGSFQDGSGIPGDFKVQYIFDYQAGTVTEKVTENTRAKTNEVNSKIHDPIILKLPLETGNTWQQEITFAGEKKTMTATIVSIGYENRTFYGQRKNGQPVLTVRYLVEDVPGYFENTYVEERRFQKGWGMIGFSNLMKGDLGITSKDDEYKIEEAILQNMFGYSLAKE